MKRALAAALALGVGLGGSGARASAADGPAPLALPDLLEEVRRANPDLMAARKRWEAAQQRIPLSKGLPPPRIGVEFEEIPRGTVKLNQATVLFSILQSLPFPGKLSLKQQVAVKEAQMAGMMFKQTEWDLITSLKSAYYEIYLLDRQMEIQQAQEIWLRQALDSARARYAAGTGSQADLLRAEAELFEAANEREVLGHRRQAAAAHLNHLLARPAEGPVGPPGEIPLVPVPSTPEGLAAQARESQPELLVFRYSAERSDASWKLAKRELWPDLETMLELRDPAMGPIGPWDLTLALALPFWFWTKQKYGVKAALYDKESAEHAYQGAQNEIARRIHEHWHLASASHATAKLHREGLIPLDRQRVASALAAYQSGRGSLGELIEALTALQERQRAYHEQLAELEQHIVMLEQAVGLPLRPAHEPEESNDS